MDCPFFILLFPFVYWLIPHNFYKVDNEKLIEKIKVPKESPNDSNKGFLSFVGIGGISLIISNLLNNIAGYFNIHTSTNVKTGILLITLFMFVFLRLYFSNFNKNNINQKIHLKQFPKEKFRIWPTSTKYILKVLFSYLLFLFVTVLFAYAFITEGDGLYLFFFTMGISITLLINFFVVMLGQYNAESLK